MFLKFFIKAIILIGLCAVSAFVSFFLTFDPSYVNPIWFPTGIGFAFLMVYGIRLWPAVLLASMITLPFRVGLSPLSFPLPFELLLISGVGCTLQTVIAVWLMRRFFGGMPLLSTVKSILQFFLLSLLVAVIGAEIGITALAYYHQLSWDSLPLNFASWWIGDAMSIFLFAPIVFAFTASIRELWGERRWSFVLPLIFSLVALLVLARVVHRWEQSRLKTGFDRKTELITKIFEKEINYQFEVLKAVQSFYRAAQDVDRVTFHEFTTPLLQSYPALASIEWLPRITDDLRDRFVSETRASGVQDFDIKSFVFPGEVGSLIRQESVYPVLYVEPFENYRVFLGFDRGSNEYQWQMLISTRESGLPALGPWVNLISKNQDKGVLCALPVYANDRETQSPQLQANRVRGYVVGAFNIRNYIRKSLREFQDEQLAVSILDTRNPVSQELIYSFSSQPRVADHKLSKSFFLSGEDMMFTQIRTLRVADRFWQMVFHTTSAYFSGNRSGIIWMVVLGGLGVLGIVAAFLLAMTGRTAEIELLVLERTGQLEDSRAHAVRVATEAQDARLRAEQAEQAALRMKEKAQEAAETKSRFLANMSHEIRTPINAILGFTDLLGQTTLDDKQVQYLRTVKSSSEMLLVIINDILDFSKIDAGKLTLEMIDFDLEYLIGDVFKMTTHKIQGKNIQTYIDVGIDVDRFVKGDPTRLRQILLNLLGNAVKFTQQGEIGIIVRRDIMKSTDEHPVIQFTVHDTGIGIPPGKTEKIFEPFNQAEDSTTRRFGGTGLGLSIVQSLVKMMHGHIWVESEHGKGSNFHFFIKLDKGAPITQDHIFPLSPEQLKGIQVMIIDENKQSREILSKYCEQLQLNLVKVAVNEHEATEYFKQNGVAREIPDLVLCDLPLATSSTNEVIRRVKEQKKMIKMIALSSDVKLGITKELEGYGFHGFLPKPVTRYELGRVIATVMGDQRRKGSIVTRHMAEELKCKGVKVLVAEDVIANQQLLKAYLDMLGCVSDFVENGRLAVEKLRKQRYDICLMDIQMPVMGGIEAVQIIRTEISKQLPVIALTAEDVQAEASKFLSAGMSDCLGKPLDIHRLRDKIAKFAFRESA